MPKKQKNPLYTRPSTKPHPSLTLSNSTTPALYGSTGLEEKPSVTECLRTLRSEEAGRLLPRPAPVATVHPSLRNLLDVPETRQPGPRTGVRASGPAQTRRVPGPAAPLSWQLLASRHTRRTVHNEFIITPNYAIQNMIHEQVPLPGAKLPPRRSLLDTVLRSMADNWDWHLQHDHYYLAYIPIRLKEALLSYISRHTSEERLTRSITTLRILFPEYRSLEEEGTGHQMPVEDAIEVMRLDLGRALGTWLRTMSSFKKEVIRPLTLRDSTAPSANTRDHSVREAISEPPEAWDDADGAARDITSQLSLSGPSTKLPGTRFSKLLHLSLALSPSAMSSTSGASWSSLLSVTPYLSTLQSLSLGYWPSPTLTPHAAAASATIRNPVARTLPRISYGGTDMYTESESNWREAAGILRKLSRHLYCLKWLDLTGCGAWFGALSWTDTEALADDLSSGIRLPGAGPDWNGSWRNVEYLGLCVGWTLTSFQDREMNSTTSQARPAKQPDPLPRSSAKVEESRASTNGLGLFNQDWDVEEERKKYFAKKELEKLNDLKSRARKVARHVRLVREVARGKWIEVDL
ncbi:hypothetical protein EPUS_05133 [Endocarpon pusillum Z07020]|uniref:Uncharacterized protein n=1 Tax=Endocarpon pusillum (strain Z07020 / HMAS-L-300199) TaxID=1263415 RepID=U1HW18_ENDPU|nr:uncharacterized protein EPUS_05133 [Endocarpon pusillum Z07020]ERF74925.1 hypothetical protein EPUS_05133 [Endocarpon pusillum Z07020]